MARMIETEMTDCLQQMAHLQAKMEVIQQEKNKQAAEEVVKQQEVEPNLRILIDWLNEYGEMIDEVERERVIVEQYEKLEKDRRRERGDGEIQEEYEFYNNREMITEKYLSLQNKKQSTKTNKKSQQLSRAEVLSNSPNFISRNHHPTYFMKQYIEATHNMFVIQQKRIDELETIIKKFEMNST